MRSFFSWGAALFLLPSASFAQDTTQHDEDFIYPEIHPSQEGSSGVYHTRSAFTFPSPGAAFEGNDHFFGDDNLYQPDGVPTRGVETRDSLTVNVMEGVDFNACSIFRAYKFDELGIPNGTLSTALPSILEAVKVAHFAKDRSWAIAIEPFYEMRSSVNDFRMDFKASPFGARALYTRDFRPDKKLPLRLHGNLGYRRDRSADLLKRAIDQGFVPPAPIPNDPVLSTEELYALGVPRTPLEAGLGLFRTDQILVSVAAEYLTKWVTPFVEYSGEYVLGGLSPLNSPQRLTLGGRFTPRPDYHDLTVDLAMDFGTSRPGQLPTTADPNVTAEVEVEAPISITVAVGWVFGHRKAEPQNPRPASLPATIPATAPATAPSAPSAAPAPLPGDDFLFGKLSLRLPSNSNVSCTGAEPRLCSVRANGTSTALNLRSQKTGTASVFSLSGPTGAPLQNETAGRETLAGQTALVWRGENAGASFSVWRLDLDGYSYEVRYEGASATDAAGLDAIVRGALLR